MAEIPERKNYGGPLEEGFVVGDTDEPRSETSGGLTA